MKEDLLEVAKVDDVVESKKTEALVEKAPLTHRSVNALVENIQTDRWYG